MIEWLLPVTASYCSSFSHPFYRRHFFQSFLFGFGLLWGFTN
jgi:hypothetical protein